MIQERVEARLAALVNGDVVGFSRLTADDPDATLEALAEWRRRVDELVADHRGRLADFTGDNFLAEFPSATDALRCAVAIQRAGVAEQARVAEARRIVFRLGAHLGEVRVQEGRLVGDGVNVAARLEALAHPGGICISGALHEQVRRLPFDFEDLGPQALKNLPEPVRVLRVHTGAGPRASAPSAPRRWSGKRSALVVAAVLPLLVALGLWASWPRPLGLVLDWTGAGALPIDPPLPHKPSIVVLPFENLSGDPEQEYFVDGFTEQLTADLSRSPGLFVISRSSAFSYKGGPVKIADVARELGVRYVLEGSVRRAEGRVRITTQLIDATQDVHLWSEQYDRELTDIFELQSEVSGAILFTLLSEVRDAEMEQWWRSASPDFRAFDAWLKGGYEFEKDRRASNAAARRWFERGIALEPTYAEAHAMYGLTHYMDYLMGWNRDPGLLEIAEASAQRALELDPNSPSAWSVLAMLATEGKDFSRALTLVDRAIELRPNFDVFYLVRGIVLAGQGRLLSALQSNAQFLRLNPRGRTGALGFLASVNYAVGRIEKAVEFAEQAREANPDLIIPRLLLIIHYDSTGRPDEARQLVTEILSVNPALTARDAVEVDPMIDAERDPDGASRYADTLRRAGLP